MATKNSKVDPEYAKYLDKDPTTLMEHITEWILEKTGFDPSEGTPEEAFERGVELTVALRSHHQASEENQARLEVAREAAEAREAEKAERRAERERVGAAARGRLPKVADEDGSETPKPARRGRKAAVAAEEAPAETPKRRGRRTAAPVAEAASEPAKPAARRGRPRKTAGAGGVDGVEAAESATVTPIARKRSVPAKTETAEDETPKPARRRAARRDGEAAF